MLCKVERGDLIQFFKEILEFNIINWQLDPYQTKTIRKSNFESMVRPVPAKCLQRENFFISKFIQPWNSPPQCVVGSVTVNQF